MAPASVAARSRESLPGALGGNLHDRDKNPEGASDGHGQLKGAALDQAIRRHGIAHSVGGQAEKESGDAGKHAAIGNQIGIEVLIFSSAPASGWRPPISRPTLRSR